MFVSWRMRKTNGMTKKSRWRALARGWFVGAILLGLACLWVRFGWLEAQLAPAACGGTWVPGGGFACAAKFLLVQAFLEERIGWVAVLCAALAQVYGSRRWAVAALALGVAATVFYAATPGVIAALWVLPRLWFDALRGWRAQMSSL